MTTFEKRLLIFLTCLVMFWGYRDIREAWASFSASPQAWTAAYELDPTATDPVSQGDDHLRQNKFEVRSRVETEMDFGEIGNVSTDTGRLLEGAARAFMQSSAPTEDNTITANCLAEADYDGNRGCDEGRLWVDDDDNALYVCDDTDSDGDCDAWESVTAVPTNALILWDQSNTCPTGYTEATEFRTLTVRGADRASGSTEIPDDAGVSCTGSSAPAGCGAAGGTDNYDEDISIDELPSHTHGVGQVGAGAGGLNVMTQDTTALQTNATGGGEFHLHPLRTVIFCRKS